MAWIESHQTVGQHPKTKKLARRLGVSLPAAVGHLHYLWWWALDFAQDGVLDKFDAEDIADALHWDGEPSQLIDALISSGYIDETPEGLRIHDWTDYAGKLLERREKDRARKAEAADQKRKSKANSDRNPTEIQRKSNGKNDEADGNLNASSVTVPNRTLPNSTVPNRTVPKTEQHRSSGDKSPMESRFSEFWLAYPKKVGKASCLKAWTKLKPNTELFAHIMDALAKQKASEQWQREAGRYIPNPLTWINQGRWDDEPVETPKVAAKTGTGSSGMLNKLREMYAAEGGDDE